MLLKPLNPFLLLLASTLFLLAGCQATPQAEQPRNPTTASSTTRNAQSQAVVTIDGMACPFCTYNVQRQLESLDGVDQAEVSLEQGKAYVALSEQSPATTEQLRRAVKSAGFTPTKVKMP